MSEPPKLVGRVLIMILKQKLRLEPNRFYPKTEAEKQSSMTRKEKSETPTRLSQEKTLAHQKIQVIRRDNIQN